MLLLLLVVVGHTVCQLVLMLVWVLVLVPMRQTSLLHGHHLRGDGVPWRGVGAMDGNRALVRTRRTKASGSAPLRHHSVHGHHATHARTLGVLLQHVRRHVRGRHLLVVLVLHGLWLAWVLLLLLLLLLLRLCWWCCWVVCLALPALLKSCSIILVSRVRPGLRVPWNMIVSGNRSRPSSCASAVSNMLRTASIALLSVGAMSSPPPPTVSVQASLMHSTAANALSLLGHQRCCMSGVPTMSLRLAIGNCCSCLCSK